MGEINFKKTKMDKVASDDFFDYFRIKVKAPSRRMYNRFINQPHFFQKI